VPDTACSSLATFSVIWGLYLPALNSTVLVSPASARICSVPFGASAL
jgi:hypothetical protein